MKHLTYLCWLLVLALLFLMANCNQERTDPVGYDDNHGQLSLTFTLTLLTENGQIIDSIHVAIDGPENAESDCVISDDTTFATSIFYDLLPGIYNLSATAFDTAGLIIGAGHAQAEVVTGKITQVDIDLQKNSGGLGGTLNVGTMTDIDGNVYKTIKIGNQWWMAENLNVTHYRNGDEITSQWAYNYDENISETYGRLYTWYAIDDSRQIAPEGWHVPSDEEWKILEIYLGMSQAVADDSGPRGTFEGNKLKEEGTAHWQGPMTYINTNESGFCALPGGAKNIYGFAGIGYHAYFWTSSKDDIFNDDSYGWYRYLYTSHPFVYRYATKADQAYSVRCVMDDFYNMPTASVTIQPTFGSCDTIFTFDASGSSDLEDNVSDLLVRWDWESDGIWDTEYSSPGKITHQYAASGIYSVTVEVKDSRDFKNIKIITIPVVEMGSVTDIDGNEYKTAKIGSQWWMLENLRVTHYGNGDNIPLIPDNNDWILNNTGAYCNYNNDANIAETYGCLYNWFAVTDARQLAPSGWHIPSDNDWQTLSDFLGGDNVAGGKMKEAGIIHWQSPNTGATNESVLSLLPGGFRLYNGTYSNLGYNALFWSSTERDSYNAWYRLLSFDNTNAYKSSHDKEFGMSVRCVKN